MVKIPLSMDLEPEAFHLFQSICEELPLNKNEVMALMVRSFAALPIAIQDELASKRPGVQDGAMKKLSALEGLDLAALGLQQGKVLRDRANQKRGLPKTG